MIQAVLILSVVSAVGVYLGKIKFFGVSLGVTFVFFAGILAGHLGIEVNKDMLNFAQNFGLIIFVYTLGLQVGPGFFSSLKKGGVELNMMGLAVIVIGILCTLIFHWTSGISIPTMVGLLSGAVTNTPALGAAQQTSADPDASRRDRGGYRHGIGLRCHLSIGSRGCYPGDHRLTGNVRQKDGEQP